MKVKIILVSLFVLISSISFAQNQVMDELKTSNGVLKIYPVLHGSLVLTHNNKTIYVDPYGGSDLYKGFKSPDIILITDTHGDHLDQKTLDLIDTSKSILIVPQAVANKLPENYNSKVIILNNGQGVHRSDYFIQAVPMYNLPEEENAKHPKGRGNGYVLNIENKRIYISGDTEDIPEMRALKDIDIAFVCMNLPWTMTVENAADAVLDFKPQQVFPYHYRGTDGFSDIEKFKNLIDAENKAIKVNMLKWYKD